MLADEARETARALERSGTRGLLHGVPVTVKDWIDDFMVKRDISVRDLADVVSFPGFWSLARRHGRGGPLTCR